MHESQKPHITVPCCLCSAHACHSSSLQRRFSGSLLTPYPAPPSTMTSVERKPSPERGGTHRSESMSSVVGSSSSNLGLLKSVSNNTLTATNPERRPSIVYEEDDPAAIAATARRGSVTIRITSEDEESENKKKRHGLRRQKSPPLIGTTSQEEQEVFNCGAKSAAGSSSPSRQNSAESCHSSNPGSRCPSPTPTVIISPSCAVANTLRVPGSGHSSSSSLDDQEDPKIILRRRSLPKARSTDFLETQMLLPSRVNLRRNTVVLNGENQAGSLKQPQAGHSLALDNFIKGRRSSAGVAMMTASLLHQHHDSVLSSRAWAKNAGRRRLSDQVSTANTKISTLLFKTKGFATIEDLSHCGRGIVIMKDVRSRFSLIDQQSNFNQFCLAWSLKTMRA